MLRVLWRHLAARTASQIASVTDTVSHWLAAAVGAKAVSQIALAAWTSTLRTVARTPQGYEARPRNRGLVARIVAQRRAVLMWPTLPRARAVGVQTRQPVPGRQPGLEHM